MRSTNLLTYLLTLKATGLENQGPISHFLACHKIRVEMGKVAEWICSATSTTQPLMYFWRNRFWTVSKII